MTRRRAVTQFSLLDMVDIRQPRRRESATVYALVVALRRSGVSVYRQGCHHRVGGGRLMTDRELRRYCHQLGIKP